MIACKRRIAVGSVGSLATSLVLTGTKRRFGVMFASTQLQNLNIAADILLFPSFLPTRTDLDSPSAKASHYETWLNGVMSSVLQSKMADRVQEEYKGR
jgi:hypothetical protein